MKNAPYKIQKYSDGQLLMTEGELSEGLFLIRAGRVEIFHERSKQDSVLGIATKGQFLGEMSILLNSPCIASARALGEVEVALFSRELCQQQFDAAPNWLMALSRGLASRLDIVNRKLTQENLGAEESSVAIVAVDMEWES